MKLKWAHFIRDELFFFFLRAPCIFLARRFFDQCDGRLSAELAGRDGIFLGRPPFWSRLQGFKLHWSEKVKTASRIKIHSAWGLAVGV
jgi:hypothetical protein